MSEAAVAARADAFEGARVLFERQLAWADGPEAAGLEHGELEARLTLDARELFCQVFQDHLDLRAMREQPVGRAPVGSDGARRGCVERGRTRSLHTVFGEVAVSRIVYRAKAHSNLCPADGVLNLPVEKHSHGLRRSCAVEAARGSYEDAQAAVERACGQRLGKRQVEQLAIAAAADCESFYAQRTTAPMGGDVLVLSCDGKGIVMRPDALRETTARAARRAQPKLKTRLSRGEKANRKRIAEVGAVYDITPAPRTSAEVLAPIHDKTLKPPKAANKWLRASVVNDAASVIAEVFQEAERRDPQHQRPWVCLVDGNNHQIDRITHEAQQRGLTITILVDLVHVLEYLWSAAWCFHKEGDPAAETWVHAKALAILDGKAKIVAASIRRKATHHQLAPEKRKNADRAADYLHNKAPHLDYPTALTNGWPIATGVIEGACRHLIKDRMDITGARWGLPGAEAILKLRAITANNDFDAYWTYHLTNERQRNHASRYADSVIPTNQ
ncbi:MAG: ISKra4 family transposase [Solirubrobacteraceae bacterium]